MTYEKWINEEKSAYQSLRMLARKIQRLMDIPGTEGVIIKVGLLCGLRAEDVISLHGTKICSNDMRICGCSDLHVVVGHNDLLVISRSSQTAMVSVIVPALLWKQFRAIELLELRNFSDASAAMKNPGLQFNDLSDIHHRIFCTSSGYHSYLVRNDSLWRTTDDVVQLLKSYCLSWERVGLILAFE